MSDNMSNYELNCRLCRLLGMTIATHDDPPFRFTSCEDAEARFDRYRKTYPDTVWARPNDGPWEQYVFTSDWNATMPLAIKYGVGYNPMCGGDYKAFEVYEKYHLIEPDCADEHTLLRTIVICLIKTLERNKHVR